MFHATLIVHRTKWNLLCAFNVNLTSGLDAILLSHNIVPQTGAKLQDHLKRRDHIDVNIIDHGFQT